MINSPVMQMKILSFAISHPNKDIFEQFFNPHPDTYKQTVTDKRVRSVYNVFKRFYLRNKQVPSRSMYDAFKFDVEEYQNTLADLTASEKTDFRQLEKIAFEEIPRQDEEEIKRRYREFCVVNNYMRSHDEVLEGYAELGEDDDVLDHFKDHSSKRYNYDGFLDNLLSDNGGDSLFVYGIDHHSVDLETTIPLVSTLSPALKIYNEGLSTIRGGAKSFKSLTGIAALKDYTENFQMDSILLDLENGSKNMYTRYWQGNLCLPSYCIRQKKYYDPSNIPENITRYNPLRMYFKDDIVWEYAYSFDRGTEGRGFRLGKDAKHFFKIRFYKALVDNPSFVSDEIGEPPHMSWAELNMAYDESMWKHTPDLIALTEKEMRAEGLGQLKIEYLREPTPREIMGKIESAIARSDDQYEGFFEDKDARLVLIDWISLMRSSRKADHISERTNNIYYELKNIRNDYNVSMIAIEGTTNAAHYQSAEPNVVEAKAKGSSEVNYNVVTAVGIYGTEDEQKTPVRRYHMIVDRYGKATQNISYIGLDPRNQQLKTISKEDHQYFCPKFWEGQEDAEELEDMDYQL